MELDNIFSIKSDKHNFILVEKIKGFKLDKTTRERIPAITEKEYNYGTLYQCLQAYLRHSVDKADSLKDVRKIATRVINTIDDLSDEIKEKFKTEVKTSR